MCSRVTCTGVLQTQHGESELRKRSRLYCISKKASCSKATDGFTHSNVETRRAARNKVSRDKQVASKNLESVFFSIKCMREWGRNDGGQWGRMSSHPRLVDHSDLNTPITAFVQENPSRAKVWAVLACWSLVRVNRHCTFEQTKLFLRDVGVFRGKVTRGGKDKVPLKASTFVLAAPVCFWQCWLLVSCLFSREVVGWEHPELFLSLLGKEQV